MLCKSFLSKRIKSSNKQIKTNVLSTFKNSPKLFNLSSSSFMSKPRNHHISWHSGALTPQNIIEDVSSMPPMSPSYPFGPYRFNNREYFIVSYITDREALESVVPEPLIPNKDNLVLYEWIKMPDSSGFGDYQESGTVIPCTLPDGTPVNYTAQMFLDCEPPIACGREIWGFPKKYAHPKLEIKHDTVFGTLEYAEQQIAVGSMTYKYKEIPPSIALSGLSKLSSNLKIIPNSNLQNLSIAQLIGYNLIDIEILGAWEGPARLYLNSNVNAPTNELPILKTLGGKHIIANLTLPYGHVLFDYINRDRNTIQPIQLDKNEEEKLKENNHHIKYTKSFSANFPHQKPARLTIDKVLQLPSMPAMSPSYPLKAPNLNAREMLTIIYETKPNLIQSFLPDLLESDSENRVIVQWSNTEGTGLGAYSKCSVLVPCRFKADHPRLNYDLIDQNETFLFSLLNIVDCSSTITIGREIYGQPQKFGHPSLSVKKDTLVASVKYGDFEVARASMTYKYKDLEMSRAFKFFETKHLNLKLIPDMNGKKEIAQLVSNAFEDISISSAYAGPIRLDFFPHVNAPFADLPVVRCIEGSHIKADLKMGNCDLLFDYLI